MEIVEYLDDGKIVCKATGVIIRRIPGEVEGLSEGEVEDLNGKKIPTTWVRYTPQGEWQGHSFLFFGCLPREIEGEEFCCKAIYSSIKHRIPETQHLHIKGSTPSNILKDFYFQRQTPLEKALQHTSRRGLSARTQKRLPQILTRCLHGEDPFNASIGQGLGKKQAERVAGAYKRYIPPKEN